MKLAIEYVIVFWQSLAHIPKRVLEKNHKIGFNFLWSRKDGQERIH